MDRDLERALAELRSLRAFHEAEASNASARPETVVPGVVEDMHRTLAERIRLVLDGIGREGGSGQRDG